MRLLIVIASTRPGRAGLPIATWFHAQATAHGTFDVELVDLAELDLPFLDEPNHPVRRQYVHEHTKAWSATVDAADAFVFVTAEYNSGTPPPLLNAIDYLNREWAYKPVAFVSYGGVSAGTRSVQMTKQVVTTIRMMPIPEAVHIPFFARSMKDGVFEGGEIQEKAAKVMLDELFRWAEALRAMRAG